MLLDQILPNRPLKPWSLDPEGLAQGVGWVAILLPIILFLGGKFTPICEYGSLSHYYYAQYIFGDIFVGSLFLIAAFLLLYNGHLWYENLAAKVAGIAAFFVAIVPASGPGCIFAGHDVRILATLPIDNSLEKIGSFFHPELVGTFHSISAAIMFIFLAYYAFFVFPKITIPEKQLDDMGNLTDVKRLRNVIYFVSGTLIIFSIIMMALARLLGWNSSPDDWWNTANMTFYFESLALITFGIAWLVKGRVFNQFRDPG